MFIASTIFLWVFPFSFCSGTLRLWQGLQQKRWMTFLRHSIEGKKSWSFQFNSEKAGQCHVHDSEAQIQVHLLHRRLGEIKQPTFVLFNHFKLFDRCHEWVIIEVLSSYLSLALDTTLVSQPSQSCVYLETYVVTSRPGSLVSVEELKVLIGRVEAHGVILYLSAAQRFIH